MARTKQQHLEEIRQQELLAASDEDDMYDDRPSKTQMKKQMTSLQKLGEQLVELPKHRLEKLALPETLLDAILQARKITNFEGKRRQLQYVGKLMRRIDAEPIAAQVEAWQNQSKSQVAYFHELERWRERLLQDDNALTDFLLEFPQVDAQALRTLIRNTRKAQQAQKSPKHFRELFQFIKSSMAQKHGLPDDDNQLESEDSDHE